MDLSRRWPSSYADGGSVGWSTTESDGGGQLKISFPNIRCVQEPLRTTPAQLHHRWKSLRATEGWAALQHHAVLRSSFTVHPPRLSNDAPALPPHLLVDLVQGSQFTVLPRAEARSSKANGPLVPRWYAGNIYAMERALPQVVELPTKPSLTGPTTYDIFVSGDYEVGSCYTFAKRSDQLYRYDCLGRPAMTCQFKPSTLTFPLKKLSPTWSGNQLRMSSAISSTAMHSVMPSGWAFVV